MRRPRLTGGGIVLLVLAWIGVASLLIFVLWNALVPAILRLPAISYWQAVGLFFLTRVLFGRFGSWPHWARRARFARGWHHLSLEERQRFRAAMGGEAPEKV